MSRRAPPPPLDIPASEEPWENHVPNEFGKAIVLPSLPRKLRKKSTPVAVVEWNEQLSPVAVKKPLLEAISDNESISPARASTMEIPDFMDETESPTGNAAFMIDEQSPGIEDKERSPCLSDLGAEALVHGEHRSAADELSGDMFCSDSDSGSERNVSFRRNDAEAEATYTNKSMASDSIGDSAGDSACNVANHMAESIFESKKSQYQNQEPNISHQDYQKYLKLKKEIVQERLHLENQMAQHMLMKEQVNQERIQLENQMAQQRKQIDQERVQWDEQTAQKCRRMEEQVHQERIKMEKQMAQRCKEMEDQIHQERMQIEKQTAQKCEQLKAQVDQERIRLEKEIAQERHQINEDRIQSEAQTTQKCKQDEDQAFQRCKQMEDQAARRCEQMEEHNNEESRKIARERKQLDEQIERERKQVDQDRNQVDQERKQMEEQIDQERKQVKQECKQMEEQTAQKCKQMEEQISQERKQIDQERIQIEQAAQTCKQTKEHIDEERKRIDQEREEMEKQTAQNRKRMEELDQQRKQIAQECEQMVQQRMHMEEQAAHKCKQMEKQIDEERRQMEAQTASLKQAIAKLQTQSMPFKDKMAACVDAGMDTEAPNRQEADVNSCTPQPSPSPSQLGLTSATSYPAQTPIVAIRGACLDFFDECQSALPKEIPYLFIKLIRRIFSRIATPLCCLINLFLLVQTHMEKEIWISANSTTRKHLLEHPVAELPLWELLIVIGTMTVTS